ncbi:hypothetical protein TL16_g01639 [Triparma laevis f. inornata]|uniref:Glycoside hydrolase 123-like N-terminal domain-containing protein n=1 Tax=Triparma laevis f. inornata TaxID=1714386 RepID=A0A9W7DTH4_9STRA|nr:hypothetical protein TL16_g01639 [Triparma laevis f. inornata]
MLSPPASCTLRGPFSNSANEKHVPASRTKQEATRVPLTNDFVVEKYPSPEISKLYANVHSTNPTYELEPTLTLPLETVARNGTWPPPINTTHFYGSHRCSLKLSPSDIPTSKKSALKVTLPWRRRDLAPETKDVRLLHYLNSKFTEIDYHQILSLSGDEATIAFEPTEGPGYYQFYYLPYLNNNQRYGQKDKYWLSSNSTCGPSHNQTCTWVPPSKLIPVTSKIKFEAETTWDLFTRMEVAATTEEMRRLHESFQKMPKPFIDAQPFTPLHPLSAKRNQYFTFQTTIYAMPNWSINNLTITFNSNNSVFASNLTCFNTEGVNNEGQPYYVSDISVNRTLGDLLPLWIGWDIASDTEPGEYHVDVEVTACTTQNDNECKEITRILPVTLTVEDADAGDERGDDDSTLLSRIRWLNNADFHTAEPPEPFTPLEVEFEERSTFPAAVINSLNKRLAIDPATYGLPSEITITPPDSGTYKSTPRPVLAGAINLNILTEANDTPVEFLPADFAEIPAATGSFGDSVTWRWNSTSTDSSEALGLDVTGSTLFDGYTDLQIDLINNAIEGEVSFDDIRLSIPLAPGSCALMMGFNKTGRAMHDVDWRWTAGHPNNMLWVGTAQSGVRLRLKGPEPVWNQPRGPFFYGDLPGDESGLPKYWHNNNKGGASLKTNPNGGCEIVAFTGPLKLSETPISLHFDLAPTPNKPLTTTTTQKHFSDFRIFQNSAPLTALEDLPERTTVVNIHQGTSINPWIIYPLDPDAILGFRDYSDAAHEAGLKIKTYYSSGSLSYYTPELWALFALQSEVIAPSAQYLDPVPDHLDDDDDGVAVEDSNANDFIAPHWLMEHAPNMNFRADWTTPLDENVNGHGGLDAAITTRAGGRLNNFWVALLPMMTRQSAVDGIYLDGVSYDAHTLLRARRALQEGGGDGTMDLHCGSRWNSGLGEINALEYTQHASVIDSFMLGEGFAYDDPGNDYDWMLLDTSGIIFGLYNDMLNGGGNPWKGATFGSVARPDYDYRALYGHWAPWMWRFWEEAGLTNNEGVELQGWWGMYDGRLPDYTTNATEAGVRLSVFKKADGSSVLAVGSWNHVNVTGFVLEPEVRARVPFIEGMQNASVFEAGEVISVEPDLGMILVVD